MFFLETLELHVTSIQCCCYAAVYLAVSSKVMHSHNIATQCFSKQMYVLQVIHGYGQGAQAHPTSCPVCRWYCWYNYITQKLNKMSSIIQYLYRSLRCGCLSVICTPTTLYELYGLISIRSLC